VDVVADRPDGAERLAEWRRLVEAHRDAGSAIARSILTTGLQGGDVWLVEPAAAVEPAVPAAETDTGAGVAPDLAAAPTPDRNLAASASTSIAGSGVRSVTA
jgi:hypothetical protein